MVSFKNIVVGLTRNRRNSARRSETPGPSDRQEKKARISEVFFHERCTATSKSVHPKTQTLNLPVLLALLSEHVQDLLAQDISLITVSDHELNALSIAATQGSFRRGRGDWSQLREKRIDDDGNVFPALWIHAPSFFFRTIEEASDDEPTIFSPSFEEFASCLQEYCIPKSAFGSNIAQQCLLYPRLLNVDSLCQPGYLSAWEPAFLTYMLGFDEHVNALLYWPMTRFQILMAANARGHNRRLSKFQQSLVYAVMERTKTRHLDGKMISTFFHRKAFERTWQGQPIPVLTQAQWQEVEALRVNLAQIARSMRESEEPSSEVAQAYKCFFALMSPGKAYGYKSADGSNFLKTSIPAFRREGEATMEGHCLQVLDDVTFRKLIRELKKPFAVLTVMRGLSKMGLMEVIGGPKLMDEANV